MLFGYADCKRIKHGPRAWTQVNGTGKQRALSRDNWPIPTKGSKIGYSCVRTMVVVRKKTYFQRGLTLVRPISRKSLKLHVTWRLNDCCYL